MDVQDFEQELSASQGYYRPSETWSNTSVTIKIRHEISAVKEDNKNELPQISL